MLHRKPFIWIKAIAEGRFIFFLTFLLLYIGFAPFLYRFLPFRRIYDLSFTAVLLAGIYAVSEQPRQSIIAALMAVPMLFLMWTGKPEVAYWGHAGGSLFLGYTIVLMVGAVLKARTVTSHVISAAVSAYLLLGVLWSFVFNILNKFQAHAFSVDLSEPYAALYYSFVTLTTLGYGDISPLTPDARALSVLEAIIGQLYLAVLVARLVGIYISQEMVGGQPGDSSKNDA